MSGLFDLPRKDFRSALSGYLADHIGREPAESEVDLFERMLIDALSAAIAGDIVKPREGPEPPGIFSWGTAIGAKPLFDADLRRQAALLAAANRGIRRKDGT